MHIDTFNKHSHADITATCEIFNGDDDLTWGEETGCSSISELD